METRSSHGLLKNDKGGRADLLKSARSQIVIALLLIGLIFAARLLPHAANFTPVAAVGLFAGVYLRGKWAPLLPLAGLLLSDLFIGGYGLRGMTIVYGSFALTFLIGKVIARGQLFARHGKYIAKFARLFAGSMIGAAAFFLITNNIFLYTPALYPMTFDGMIASYVMGIPFFRNQILGDLVYGGALFGLYEMARVWSARWILRSNETV